MNWRFPCRNGDWLHFFWSGLPTVACRINGVGFAVRTALLQSTQESPIVIDQRLMTWRLPLAKNRFATFVSVYSQTSDTSYGVKDRFYDTLYSTIRRISLNDKIILMGDFHARVDKNHDKWHGVIGHHGVGNMNSSGLRLLSLCSDLGLAITNTFFQLHYMHKTSWMHPRSNTGNSLTTSLSGDVIWMKCKLLEPCLGQSAQLITA